MNYIKLDTTKSTNDFLKSYSKMQNLPDFFYVYADMQTEGRGQRTHTWESECCKNLLISILTKPHFSLSKQILLNKIVSLALIELLEKHQISTAQVKLPNDIMADQKKIAGILIENSTHAQKITQSIIGIGLNVNQSNFVNLPEAISMSNILNVNFDIDQIAQNLVKIIKNLFSIDETTIHKRYQALSFYKASEN